MNFLKVGQNLKEDSIIGYQGASNNLGVTMASHLHIQFQNYEALGEYAFTCTGINAYNIDIITSKPTSGKTPSTTNKAPAPAVFNKYKGRKTKNTAYARGFIRNADGLGTAVRKWSKKTFANKHRADLVEGEEVYIFAKTNTGWGRIYSASYKGWIYLERVQITEVY